MSHPLSAFEKPTSFTIYSNGESGCRDAVVNPIYKPLWNLYGSKSRDDEIPPHTATFITSLRERLSGRIIPSDNMLFLICHIRSIHVLCSILVIIFRIY